MKKYVLTGGPSVGKTTALNILSSIGWRVIPEAADIIIKESPLSLSRDEYHFQEKIAQKQLNLEANIGDGEVFLDRGIVDGYAYCRYAGVNIPQVIIDNGRDRYDKVFILDSLGIYEKDGTRFRSLEEACKIHEFIKEAYREFGYNLTPVPVMSPENRVQFILDLL